MVEGFECLEFVLPVGDSEGHISIWLSGVWGEGNEYVCG